MVYYKYLKPFISNFFLFLMKFKEIALAGLLFLSSNSDINQSKINFDVYTDFPFRLKTSSINIDKREVNFSFLKNIYSIEFKKINDSTYQEIVKNNFFRRSEEVFDYSFKDSCYTFINYSSKKGKLRQEKEDLEGRVFDKKYDDLPQSFEKFEKENVKDSLHIIILGIPYSFKVEKRQELDEIVYSCILNVSRDPGDTFIASYPIEAYLKKENGKLKLLRFFTRILNVKHNYSIGIEGKLKKERD